MGWYFAQHLPALRLFHPLTFRDQHASRWAHAAVQDNSCLEGCVKAYTLAYLERLYNINGYQTLDQIHGHLDVPCLTRIQIHGAEVDPWRGLNRPNMGHGPVKPSWPWQVFMADAKRLPNIRWRELPKQDNQWDNTRNTRHQEDATPSWAQANPCAITHKMG